MDSILLLSSEEEKLARFLTKLGYSVLSPRQDKPLKDLLQQELLDLVIVDSLFELDCLELMLFLRGNENTRRVPIMCLTDSAAAVNRIKEANFDRVEVLPRPYSIGTVVSRIATQLRLRKLAGMDSSAASLAEINATLRDLNERFERELAEAKAIQHSLLPESIPQDDRYEIAVSYQPLEAVGGDWYYCEKQSNGTLTAQIADVTGHGLSAAFIGSMTKLAMSAAASNDHDPGKLLREMNRLMAPQLPGGRFVTIGAMSYEPDSGRLTYARAGHPAALHLARGRGSVTALAPDGFAVGFFNDSDYVTQTVELAPGDLAVLYTDGISEAQNRSKQQYGQQRLGDVLTVIASGTGAAESMTAILQDFEAFCDGRLLKDDVTLFVLRRNR